MNELEEKITAVLRGSEHDIYDNALDVASELWEFDCVRDRVLSMQELADAIRGMRDPSKKLMGKRVTIKKYIGDEYNEEGVVRGYDPKSKKWRVTNMNMPFQGTVSAWFSEEELIVQ
jgi:hypothetical protein